MYIWQYGIKSQKQRVMALCKSSFPSNDSCMYVWNIKALGEIIISMHGPIGYYDCKIRQVVLRVPVARSETQHLVVTECDTMFHVMEI